MLARFAELVGLALLAALIWRILFPETPSFFLLGTVVGIAGILSAWLAGTPLRTPIDGPLLVYVGLSMVSVLVNHGRFRLTLAANEPLTSWQPLLQLAALTIYFYGVYALLATEERVALLVTALVLAIGLFGFQAGYDHLIVGFDSRMLDYPSLLRWTGYTPLGLLFSIGFGLTLPLVVVPRSPVVAAAAAFLSLTLLLDAVGVYSRATTVSVALTYAAVGAVEFFRWKGVRLFAIAAGGAVVLAGVLFWFHALTAPIGFVRGDFYSPGGNPSFAYESRFGIWHRVIQLIAQYPWLGVGAGNYSDAIQTFHAKYRLVEYQYNHYIVHAHNMLLHVAAESGIPASLAFLLVWARLLRATIRTCDRHRRGVLAGGVFAALVAFFVKGMFEHSLAGLEVSTRVNFLLWTLFAAAAALTRQMPPAAAHAAWREPPD